MPNWCSNVLRLSGEQPLIDRAIEAIENDRLCEEFHPIPEELKSTSAPPKKEEWDTDENHFKRWDYVLDELIFAFEKLNNDDWEEPFFANGFDKEGWQKVNDRINNGLRLFGVYYRSLWD